MATKLHNPSTKGTPMTTTAPARALRPTHPMLRDERKLPVTSPTLAHDLGLDWDVATVPAFILDGEGNPRPVPGSKVITRTDNGNPLGVVGDRFVPLSNVAALDLFRQVADPDATIAGVQMYNGGRQVSIAARIPSLTLSHGADRSDGFVMLSNHHGTGSLSIDLLIVRLVCSNGARHWLTESSSRMRHTASIVKRVEAIGDQWAETIAQWAGYKAEADALIATPTAPEYVERLTLAAFDLTLADIADETDRSRTIRENKLTEIRGIRRSPTCNVDGTAGTLYSDLQAVTEWVNHRADDDGESALFNGGAEMIERATSAAVEIAAQA